MIETLIVFGLIFGRWWKQECPETRRLDGAGLSAAQPVTARRARWSARTLPGSGPRTVGADRAARLPRSRPAPPRSHGRTRALWQATRARGPAAGRPRRRRCRSAEPAASNAALSRSAAASAVMTPIEPSRAATSTQHGRGAGDRIVDRDDVEPARVGPHRLGRIDGWCDRWQQPCGQCDDGRRHPKSLAQDLDVGVVSRRGDQARSAHDSVAQGVVPCAMSPSTVADAGRSPGGRRHAAPSGTGPAPRRARRARRWGFARWPPRASSTSTASACDQGALRGPRAGRAQPTSRRSSAVSRSRGDVAEEARVAEQPHDQPHRIERRPDQLRRAHGSAWYAPPRPAPGRR